MIVSFSNLAEFLADLKAEAAVDDKIVRLSVTEIPVNETQVNITLTAGFMSLAELRQLSISCGTDYLPSQKEGSEKANSMAEEIRSMCRENDLIVRGGKFEGT